MCKPFFKHFLNEAVEFNNIQCLALVLEQYRQLDSVSVSKDSVKVASKLMKSK